MSAPDRRAKPEPCGGMGERDFTSPAPITEAELRFKSSAEWRPAEETGALGGTFGREMLLLGRSPIVPRPQTKVPEYPVMSASFFGRAAFVSVRRAPLFSNRSTSNQVGISPCNRHFRKITP